MSCAVQDVQNGFMLSTRKRGYWLHKQSVVWVTFALKSGIYFRAMAILKWTTHIGSDAGRTQGAAG